MAIEKGDTIPEATLLAVTADGPQPVETRTFFAGRTVVLFAVPGAFTPTCSERHLPGFVQHAEALRAKGMDERGVFKHVVRRSSPASRSTTRSCSPPGPRRRRSAIA